MPEDDDLQIGVGHRALVRPERAEEAAQEEIEQGPDHGGALCQMTAPGFMLAGIEFLDPTGFTQPWTEEAASEWETVLT